jgi:Flp pilus assembly secretin CpaC
MAQGAVYGGCTIHDVVVDMVDTSGDWSVRKSIGFQSEEQYQQYKSAAKTRGLTVAQFFSWVADAFLQFNGETDSDPGDEVLAVSGSNQVQLTVTCSEAERDSLKNLARNNGLSMGQYLLSFLKPKGSKVTDDFLSNESLATLALLEYYCDFGDLANAKEQAKALRRMANVAIGVTQPGAGDGKN